MSKPVVHVEIQDQIAWVTIDSPPVNATSTAVREGLLDAVHQVETHGARSAVLRCAGKTFIAGGDMTEFDAPPVQPDLPDVVQAIEDCNVPWIAAMHGSVLGGGFEVAMGCVWRVAVPGTKFGLPEVLVGLVPGAGGTQRLPRLVGAQMALEMTTSGKPVPAEVLMDHGGLDRILPDLSDKTLAAFVEHLPERREKTRLRTVSAPDPAVWDAERTKLTKSARGLDAPLLNLEMVKVACETGFDEGQPKERALFLELRNSSQARALRHAFFAERRAAQPGAIKGHPPRQIDEVAVVGGGLMGAGIATACLNAGLSVILIERDGSSSQAGRDRVAANIDGAVRRGKLSQEAAKARMGQLQAVDDYAAAASADLAIEAVFEDVAVKREVFASLDAVMDPEAILATNTSYLDPQEIFSEVSNPSRCLGLHFFSPAHVMKLLEIVRMPQTDPAILASSFALARRLGKNGVLSGICDGFIGNRMLAAYRRQADYILADGALPHQVDAAMTGFGMPMGPYRLQDMTGLQISWANRKRQAATRSPDERYVTIGDTLCEMGRFGERSGSGWYLYQKGSKSPQHDPVSDRVITAYSEDNGITRQSFSSDTIRNRMIAALINEGALIVEEGIADDPSDVDVVQMLGYGFPRWRGGPMHYAHEVGLKTVAQWMGDVMEQSPGSWTMSRLLAGA